MLPQRRRIKNHTPSLVKVKGLKKAPLQMGHGFYNTTNRPLTIAKRNGVKFVLPPTPGVNYYESGLLVNYAVNSTPGVKIDLTTILTEEEESCFKGEREVIREEIAKATNKDGRGYFSAEVNFFVSLPQLLELQSIYVPNLDMVVSVLDLHEIPEHPFNNNGLSEEFSNTHVAIEMLLIDNLKKCPKLSYINLGPITCLVNPTTSFAERDGLYVVCKHAVDDNNEMSNGHRKVFIRLEDLMKPNASIGLYSTYADAIANSDIDRCNKLLERELEELRLVRQVELEKFKKESDEQRVKHEKEMRALAEEQAKMEHARKQTEHALNLSSLDRKDQYESASVQRKGFLETVKTWGPALAGLAVLAAKATLG